MFETAIALYAAHVAADFVLQTDWIAANKKRPPVLALHILIVIVAAAVLAATLSWPPLLLIGVSHLAIDLWKQLFGGHDLTAFCIDQTAHFLAVVAVAMLFPLTFAQGAWFALPAWMPNAGINASDYLWFLTVAVGAIVAVRAGGFAVGMFIDRLGYRPPEEDPGLDEGGFYIGLLERVLIFVLVLTNQVAGIGFLVAAKSILRFSTAQDRKMSEYVIIGTLASFTWALVAAILTVAALERLAS